MDNEKPNLPQTKIANEFASWPLDEKGKADVDSVKQKFTDLLTFVQIKIPGANGRYLSMVTTKLEEACMLAVKGISKPVL